MNEYKIDKFDLFNKFVFLRCDLNVTQENNKIISDFKIQASEPTIKLLISKGARIILATHRGRPKNHERELSTKILLPWFKERGYNIQFSESIENAQNSKENLKAGQILLLENLRFYKEEQENNIDFAKKLQLLAPYYINDAFGVLHRTDTSVSLLPTLYDNNHKSIGLLIKKEIEVLEKIKTNPENPFILILGGAKVKDKLPLLKYLIGKVNSILICPAIAFTFLKTQSKETGTSLVDENLLDQTKNIINKAKQNNVKIILPVDFLIAKKDKNGPLSIINDDKFQSDSFGISIGPKTIDIFTNEIKNAKTIFLNGIMGFLERPETLEPFRKILNAIIESKGYSIIGGGDTLAAAEKFKIISKIDFCSVGGGATLSYLTGQQLSGLKNI